MKKQINLADHVPSFKPDKRVGYLAVQLASLNYSEWQLLKEVMDDAFNTKVAEAKLDDLNDLKQRLEFEFSSLNKGEKLLLLSSFNTPD